MEKEDLSDDHLEIHKIAFEQGLRGLDSQASDLSSIRQRATAVIGISGLASSLLGREALKLPSGFVLWLNMGAYEWAAIICMVISVVCTFHILKPKTGWIFHFSPSNINNQYAKGKSFTDLSITYKELSEFAEENYNKNINLLASLYKLFSISLLAVLLQLIFWMLAIR